jgi:transposase InsO family protein
MDSTDNDSLKYIMEQAFNDTLWKEAQQLSIHEVVEFDDHEPIDWENDTIILFTDDNDDNEIMTPTLQAYTAYKRVGQKVHPVSGTFPEEARVIRQFPEDPLLSLPLLTTNPPEFTPTQRLTTERIKEFNLNSDGFLWPEEEKLFLHILKLNEATLPFEEKDRGTLRQDYFSDYIMATIPHTPWEFKNIPIPPGIRDKVIALLKSKIDAGVYEPSQSSYRGRWFCVAKKNGSLRIVHDLQPLNKVSIRDAGQLPVLDDFVESYSGRQCYTVFDLFWGFDGRIVDPRSRDMTAFYSPLGLLRLTALPMGYTNSPAEFQKCMTFILQDEIPHVANIFIDDLPIKGPKTQYLDSNGKPEVLPENPGIRQFIWEHAQDVHRVMHRIKHAGATFSPKKTQICRPEVLIVGQKCTSAGRLPDDARATKILNWPVPQTVKEVRGFLGLCGTVRIWIKNYSQLARPLTQLWRKNSDFVWTPECQESFETLKKLVSSPPALMSIDYTSDRPVVLQVDTSNIAIGMILLQEDENGQLRPVRYGSIPLNERESRYSQPKLELYGLFRALRAWRIYLIGVKKLIVAMDAIAVKGILINPDIHPSNTINRWIQGVLLYDFEFKHVPATKFLAPDALSRRRLGENETIESEDDLWLDDVALLVIPSYPPAPFIFHKPTPLPYHVFLLPTSQRNLSRAEKRLQDIRQFLIDLTLPEFRSNQERKRFLKSTNDYFTKEVAGKLHMYKRNKTELPCLVIFSLEKRLAILTQSHEKLGHKGEEAVYDLLRTRFYWPHMRTDVHHHVSSCHECQIRNTKRLELPVTISVPVTIFQKVYIDVMYMPRSGGKQFIVAAKDDLTGISEVRALSSNNSEQLANFFEKQIYLRYGCIGQVVTDNGPEVKGAFEILMKRLGIPQVRISPYNKHANGVVERGHYILREAIIKSCKKNSDGQAMQWESKIDLAAFADRVTISSVTGYSPYYLLHGMHPVLPFDLFEATFLVEGFHTNMDTSELLALRIRQLEKHDNDLERASEVLKTMRLRSKEQFNRRYARKLQKPNYPIGSLVLVRNSRLEDHLNSFKVNPRYLGPYVVVRKTQAGTYILSELDGAIHKEHYAAFRLIAYIKRNDPILVENIDEISITPEFQNWRSNPESDSE